MVCIVHCRHPLLKQRRLPADVTLAVFLCPFLFVLCRGIDRKIEYRLRVEICGAAFFVPREIPASFGAYNSTQKQRTMRKEIIMQVAFDMPKPLYRDICQLVAEAKQPNPQS